MIKKEIAAFSRKKGKSLINKENKTGLKP